MNNISLIPPFWPSGRLLLKFFIGFVYEPLLFLLLFWLFYRAIFLEGIYLVLFFLLFVVGPISIGLLLSPGWRGIRAGLVTVIANPVLWYIAAIATQDVSSIDHDLQLQLGLVAAGVVILLEIMTGDVGGQAKIVGLGIGIAVGLFLVFLNGYLIGPFHLAGNDALMSFSLYPPNALVWLSALFFPQWVSRQVGWGGAIVWIVLISIVFGLSFMLLK